MYKLWKYLVLISFIVIIDQLTKGWIQSTLVLGESFPVIDGFFSINHVLNKGAAFGMGQNYPLILRKFLFLLIPVGACIWLGLLLWKSRNGLLRHRVIYSLILAGAIGNLIDRFSMGHVVDFLSFYYKDYYFPSFNIADSSISLGAIGIIYDMIKEKIEKK